MLKFCIYLAIVFGTASVHASALCSMEGNQSEMNACAALKHQAQKEGLDSALAEVLAIAKSKNQGFGPQPEDIQRSQDTWLSFAEQHCRLLVTWGGSMAAMQYHLCMADLYEQRQKQISVHICHPALGPCSP
ncbi:lysozyme inhibitor LprI family protein [Zhongshania sp. BJYM1]|uniref:lysozyme inhibitor LprI family protein n=1 Tax=Zhongshania aquatica TaxID=2965069 RepID=UPI0022B438ED|nr:lysozyme inhibitor LprI family protein [Marortus sp. BJYM1]